jgi:bis(5'-nucleosyl)-tetraphosphatase (symmetrical)
MATYVIGDVHGCWQTLQRLLERIGWRPSSDELWLVGDLVNRGPGSLDVLRWAADHDDRLVSVLGNHDLHLIARAYGLVGPRSGDRLEEILSAPDRDRLVDWLRRRPLLHRRGDSVMVHAGLWPGWGIKRATHLARAIGDGLSGDDCRRFLGRLLVKPRPKWSEELEGADMLAAAAAIFTRLRVVREDGRPKLGFTGAPAEIPDGCTPWFSGAKVLRNGRRVVFGHWAMLGFYRHHRATCLDSGCVYGGTLSAIRLDDDREYHEPVADPIPPLED